MRALDLLLAVLLAPLAFALLYLWMRITRPKGKPYRRVVLLLTSVPALGPLSAVEQDYHRILYRHAHTDFTVAVHTAGPRRWVGRMAKGVAAINRPIAAAPGFRRWFPALGRLYEEIAGIAFTYQMVRRFRPAVIEYLGPGPMAPRAWLIAMAFPARLMTQVRGNIDLLNQIRGHASLIRARGRLARFLGGLIDKLIYAVIYRRCDLVIGYNVNNLASAISNGADPRKTRLSRIHIDDTMLTLPPRPRAEIADLPQTGRIVMAWGRLGAEKAVREAVQGVLPVMRRHADLNLFIIGDGAERPAIEADIAAAGLGERARITGWRDRAYIAAAARHADVVLVPLGGGSLVEAALLERPILSFDIEWHSEMISHGETGMLADYADPGDVARCLEAMLAEPERAAAMARAARARAERMFDRATIAKREARLIEALLADLPGRIA